MSIHFAIECLRLLRPLHWFKNALILLPAFFVANAVEGSIWPSLAMTLIGFCFLSSAVYSFNDVLDVGDDQKHPWKRFRPVAQGSVLGAQALLISFLCAVTGLFLVWWVSALVFMIGLVYLGFSAFYSLALKKVWLIDVMVLATLYSLRLSAGYVIAYQSRIPSMLLAPSFLLFLSFALVKRRNEIEQFSIKEKLPGRGYSTSSLPLITALGWISAMSALSLFAVLASGVMGLFVALLAMWTIRLWLSRKPGEDPIAFAMTDRFTWLCGTCGVALALFQIF